MWGPVECLRFLLLSLVLWAWMILGGYLGYRLATQTLHLQVAFLIYLTVIASALFFLLALPFAIVGAVNLKAMFSPSPSLLES